ncbi:hypothetical protein PG993_009806 [Apiospora rasikravindrae]|uniref:Aquaporin n=1 Tax=Apiospora rasikravindrae TaxID=990691 RepID=A0ABR1SKF5_9PEZI
MNVDRPGHRIRMPWESRNQLKVRSVTSGSLDDGATVASSPRHIPILSRCPTKIKNHLVAMLSEFVGTFMFLFFAFGGTNAVNTAPTAGEPLNANPAKLLYISLCFGMSLMVNAWVFFRISGGLFNPAVTLVRSSGGIAASAVIYGLLPGPLNIRTNLGGGTTVVQGLFIEMFLTAELVFTIFMLAAEKHKATYIAPRGHWGVYYTGGSLNPARSFGPCVVLASFSHYHWIYWVGPILGSLVASGFYLLVKALEYETVNPDQDSVH